MVFLIATVPNPMAPSGTQANCSIPANTAILFPTFNVEWSAQEAIAKPKSRRGKLALSRLARAAPAMPHCTLVPGPQPARVLPEQRWSRMLMERSRGSFRTVLQLQSGVLTQRTRVSMRLWSGGLSGPAARPRLLASQWFCLSAAAREPGWL